MKIVLSFFFSVFVFIVTFFLIYICYAFKKTFPETNFAPGLFVEDPICLYKNKPGFIAENIKYVTGDSGERKEYYVDAKVHQLGFRTDDAVDETILPGGILILGDSISWGWPCKNIETYGAVLAKKVHLPFYNFGTSSYGWHEAVHRYEQLGQTGILSFLKPKYVVVGSGYWMFERSTSPFYPTWDLPLLHPYWAYDYQTKQWSLVSVPELLHQKNNFKFSKKIYAKPFGILSFPYKIGLFTQMSPRWISTSLYRHYLNKCKNLDPMYPKPWLKNEILSAEIELFIEKMQEQLKITSENAGIDPKFIYLAFGDLDGTDKGKYIQALKNVGKKKLIRVIDGYAEAKKMGLDKSQFYGHCPPAGHEAFGEAIYQKIKKKSKKSATN